MERKIKLKKGSISAEPTEAETVPVAVVAEDAPSPIIDRSPIEILFEKVDKLTELMTEVKSMLVAQQSKTDISFLSKFSK
jgi:hypothetical protein